jgi:hypothetical protein
MSIDICGFGKVLIVCQNISCLAANMESRFSLLYVSSWSMHRNRRIYAKNGLIEMRCNTAEVISVLRQAIRDIREQQFQFRLVHGFFYFASD